MWTAGMIPRLVSIAALRRRGFTPESIAQVCGALQESPRANSSVDYAMLEYCIREDLKLKKSRVMAVLDPVKLVIDNYPEGQMEELDVPNNLENEALGSQKGAVLAGNSILSERTLWRSRRKNISACSRAMKCA